MRHPLAFSAVSLIALALACSASKSKRTLSKDAGASGAAGTAGGAGSSGTAGQGGHGTGGTAGSAGSGGALDAGADSGDAATDSGAPKCPAGMADGPNNDFCIDSTEVPRKAYANWIATQPSTTSQDTYCAFNTDFTPNSTSGDCTTAQFLDDLAPQTCVDWCDAQAFCKGQGKRLCGQVGGPGGVVPGSSKVALLSQWYAACTNGGTRKHPYGSFAAGKCNDASAGTGEPAKVPYASGACPGGVAALYDMSGNVAEWIDSCTASKGASDQCLIFGGSYLSSASEALSCDGSSSASRNTPSASVGFRCCKDI